MNQDQARKLVKDTFTQAFDKNQFLFFIRNLLNHLDESDTTSCNVRRIKDAYKPHVDLSQRLATYYSPDGSRVDILFVRLTNQSKLSRTRTAIRNFVADYLAADRKNAALVAFVSPSENNAWRFSYVKMEYAAAESPSGNIAIEERLTPARRFSYIVGPGESCHTAQARFLDLLQNTQSDPSLSAIEDAFSVEAVTKEFFERYKELFLEVKEALDDLAKKDSTLSAEFTARKVNTADFAKKLMGQIVFLYFLQKKGWLGVAKGQPWGTGPHDFLRKLANGDYGRRNNFFNDTLEPLFYDTLATDRGHEAFCQHFGCRIPFLNGGLFEPLNNYNWRKTEISLPNRLFSNSDPVEEGVTGTGILDVFDRYNFTVNEAEPLEKEVAIDPEMLGKVFENLLGVAERKSKGSFYTPREIVHYMCQESLINYLDTAANTENPIIPRADIEEFIHHGDRIADYDTVTANHGIEMPAAIKDNARLLDEKLAAITVCDPAIGSGAFPVGMMHEIVRARSALTPYIKDARERSVYQFKRHAIQSCLYGVDIDPGAVEIAKLRLWLSLVVDEEDVKQIKPLPNLDYRVVTGNSLLGLDHMDRLFNANRLDELEELRSVVFDEADHGRRAELREKIERLINDITQKGKVFDLGIAFSEVFRTRHGFDVVIGNPPYGFRTVLAADEKSYFRKVRGIQFPTGDVAELFIILSTAELVRPDGILTFIIPKKSLYGESWGNVRKLWLKHSLGFLMDASKAFENVLLEQASFSIRKSAAGPTNKIAVGRLNSDSAVVQVFGTFDQADIFTQDLRNAQIYRGLYPKSLLQKIAKGALADAPATIRGEIGLSNLTEHLTFEVKDGYPCVKGIDIFRYGLKPVGRYIPSHLASKHLPGVAAEKLIAQEIVAHVQNPQPHIVMAMFLDRERRLLNDTCVQIIISDQRLDARFVMAYFHSTFANWYAYNFVYNRAIRTMHLIDYYIRQIVLPRAALDEPATQKPIIARADRIMAAKAENPDADTRVLERENDQLVYQLYALTQEEIAIVEGTTTPTGNATKTQEIIS
ncbi:MAG: hypothetical protein HKL96_07040 [Phycisphaerales bacterium]|nr:hypothetical protein [Phycisphaerales bacterium]